MLNLPLFRMAENFRDHALAFKQKHLKECPSNFDSPNFKGGTLCLKCPQLQTHIDFYDYVMESEFGGS